MIRNTPSPGSKIETEKESATHGVSPHGAPHVPDHELLRLIDRGSYGEVWLARSVLGAYRAVKVVYRQTFDSERPYEREFAGIQRFEPISRSHEGLVDILQVGRNDEAGYYYYVMELADDVRGAAQKIVPSEYEPKTLAKELQRRRRLPPAECVHIGASLAAALAHLHKQGLIHRDVKPSNVIFVNGTPKIADIGLVAEPDASRSFVGTEGFIPPEGPGSVQADLYSFGKVLYEMCSGQDRRSFPELPTEAGEVSGGQEMLELNEIVLKACDVDLNRRYRTADELHGDLILLQAGKSVQRLRILEYRFQLAIKAGVVAALVLLIAAGVCYQISRELKRAAENRRQKVGQFVAHGNRAADEGDLLGALPWFAEALMLDRDDPDRSAAHRLRLASILRLSPKLVGMLFEETSLNYIDVSRSGRLLIAAGKNGKATVWDLATQQRIATLGGHTDEVECGAFSADERLVVTASVDRTVRIWEISSGALRATLLHPGKVYRATFDSTGDRVLTGCEDTRARIWHWQTTTNEPALVFTGHTDGVRHVAFSPDGALAVSAGEDATARVWNADSGELAAPPLRDSNWIYHAAFSPDGARLVTANFDRRANVWDWRSGRQLQSFRHRAPVYSARFSPDGRFVVTACWDFTARLWSVATGQEAGPALRHSFHVMQALISPDGRHIITGGRDQTIRIWDMAGHSWFPSLVAASFSADGSHYVTSSNNLLQVWSGTGSAVSPVFGPNGTVIRVLLNNDASKLVTFSTNQNDGAAVMVHTWDGRSGKPMSEPFACPDIDRRATLSGDGTRLATASGTLARIWDLRAGTFLALQHSADVSQVVFGAKPDRIVTLSGSVAVLWNGVLGRAIAKLPHPAKSRVHHAEFSPDGTRLITSCRDGGLTELYAEMWNAENGEPLGRRFKHRDGVLGGSFSPDGRFVVTASEDRAAQIWSVASGERVGPELKHEDEVYSAVFSRDGQRLLTACRDGTARLWDCETGEPLTPPLAQPPAWKNIVWSARFVRQDGAILSEARGQTLLWTLPNDARDVDHFAAVAQLFSGYQTQQSGWTEPLTSERFAQLWVSLREKYPEDFATPAREVGAWHERQAVESERARDWFAALFHLERLRALNPSDAQLEERRRHAERMLGAAAARTQP